MKSPEFLKAILGAAGASAMAPLIEASPGLAAYLPARAALSWVSATASYTGFIPGTEIPLVLQKTEYGWNGGVGSDSIYAFDSAPAAHVAAALTVFLDATPGRPDLKEIDFARLGKTIDALVKAQKNKGAAAGTGVHAKPIGPDAPIPPTATAPDAPAAGKPKKSKLPKKPKPAAAAKPASMKLTLSESRHICPVCLGSQFKDQSFKGCWCFRSLSKSVTAVAVPGGYNLTFGDDWDEDAVLTLSESLGR